MEEKNKCFITYFDNDGDEYSYDLTPSKVSALMHALNRYRADYCVHTIEFKVLSDMFDWLEFCYDSDRHDVDLDDACPFPDGDE